MSLLAFLPLVVALGIWLVPVWLLRQRQCGRAQDYLVASQRTRPEVVRNASIAYALRMAAFGPLFAWGASGDLWPAIIASGCGGLGIGLIYVLRRPLAGFLDGALSEDRSITVNEFIARQHGGDPRVRLAAASLTLCTLLGLLAGEALALAAFLRPILGGGEAVACALVLGGLLLIVLAAVLSGHSGIMQSAQLQLGMLYLALFGSTAILLYMILSTRAPIPAHATLAIVLIAACSAIVLGYRSTKYVDTDPIRGAAVESASGRLRPGARALSRFGKILNICLSLLLVLIIALAVMAANAEGWATIARDSATALQSGTRIPGAGLLALGLLPLFQPLCDVTNWLRLAAARKDGGGSAAERSAELRGVLRTYAVETSLLWLVICMFGAIAAVAVATQDGGADAVQAFVARLVSGNEAVTAVVLSLLLICVFAFALSTMGALLSASLCTIRYDLFSPLRPLTSARPAASEEAAARRRTLAAGSGLSLAFVVAFCVAEASLRTSLDSGTLLAVLFALCCAQLSFTPLVLGPMVGRGRSGSGTVSPGWALAILGCGPASGIAAVAMYLTRGVEAWLWSAVPVCLGSGLLLFAIARAASRRAP